MKYDDANDVQIGRLNTLAEFRFEIPSECWENFEKTLEGTLFAAPCIRGWKTLRVSAFAIRGQIRSS